MKAENPEDYSVDVLDRIRELTLNTTVRGDGKFIYTFKYGFETLKHQTSADTGSLIYQGQYHPNEGLCEGGGVCKWCGRTLDF